MKYSKFFSGRRAPLLAAVALCALAASCGGGAGSNNANSAGTAITQQIASCTASLPALAVPTTGNSVPVILDAGPCAYGVPAGSSGAAPSVFVIGAANVPFTSVTVCKPGTTTCQTIDHVLVDTGSNGLRLMSSVVSSTLSLPAITTGSGPLIECIQFADGYSWGSMHRADVKLAGEFAGNIPIQVIGDASSFSVPSTCSSTSTHVLNDVISFGANGVLGIGVFNQDCGQVCTTYAANTLYYSCPSTTTCAESTAALTDQATNPVSAFTADFNGVLLQIPALASATGALNLRGTLTFGINTQSDNQTSTVSPGAQIYLADSTGDFFSTITSVTGGYTFNATAYGNSFLDSGSNGIYIPGTNIPTDPTLGWFLPVVAASGGNPADVITLGATQRGSMGTGYSGGSFNSTQTGSTNTFSFTIANASTVLFPSGGGNNTAFASLGAAGSGKPNSTGGIDWGMPFFFGRPVFVGLEGWNITLTSGSGVGPLWAY